MVPRRPRAGRELICIRAPAGAGPRRELPPSWAGARSRLAASVFEPRLAEDSLVLALSAAFSDKSGPVPDPQLHPRSALARAPGPSLSQRCGGAPAAGGRGPQAPDGPLARAHCLPLQVVLLGMDILSALVTRLQDRFRRRLVQVSSPPPGSAFTGSPHTLHVAVPAPEPALVQPPVSFWPPLPGPPPPPPASADAAPLPSLPSLPSLPTLPSLPSRARLDLPPARTFWRPRSAPFPFLSALSPSSSSRTSYFISYANYHHAVLPTKPCLPLSLLLERHCLFSERLTDPTQLYF